MTTDVTQEPGLDAAGLREARDIIATFLDCYEGKDDCRNFHGETEQSARAVKNEISAARWLDAYEAHRSGAGEPVELLDLHIHADSEIRRRNRNGEQDERGCISHCCEAGALDLVVKALQSSGFQIVSALASPAKAGELARLKISQSAWEDSARINNARANEAEARARRMEEALRKLLTQIEQGIDPLGNPDRSAYENARTLAGGKRDG